MIEATACTAEEKRQALERALQSRTFARSDQLRAFLRFICEADLLGSAESLTEYVIGVEVLGRPEGYSPAEDSSVRTRAYELRQKLEKLYSVEFPNEPVRVVIPKGSYSPQFVKSPVLQTVEVPKTGFPDELETQRGPRLPGKWRLGPAGVAGALVAALCGLLIGYVTGEKHKAAIDPIITEAWQPMARTDADVLLSPATPLHLVVGPEGHEAYGSPSYPAPPEAYPLFREHRPLLPGARLGLLFTDNVLGVGTMNAVVAVVNTLRGMGASYQVLPERVAMLSAIRDRNAVLFGAPVDSEAITRVTETTPLTVDYEPSVKEFVIRDRSTGSMTIPKKDAKGDFIDVYGLVTVLNTRFSKERGRLGLVVFSGITSAGTHGAAEYFTSPRALRALKAVFAGEGLKGFPPAYQVVVKCTFSDMLLVSDEYDSHRILQRE
ncbi:MAG TPA: hypothetical protein VG675_17435 [Bryobacteraceae bacterium]|nr:hypothetical protein [Bryobacteraceae bacterium]